MGAKKELLRLSIGPQDPGSPWFFRKHQFARFLQSLEPRLPRFQYVQLHDKILVRMGHHLSCAVHDPPVSVFPDFDLCGEFTDRIEENGAAQNA